MQEATLKHVSGQAELDYLRVPNRNSALKVYFRKGHWHIADVSWEDPLFAPFRTRADGFFVDALLKGHSYEAAKNISETKIYAEILGISRK